MRHVYALAAVVLTVMAAAAGGQVTTKKGEAGVESRARDFVNLLAGKEFGRAVETFDATMKGAMPEAKLKGAWESVMKGWGSLGRLKGRAWRW